MGKCKKTRKSIAKTKVGRFIEVTKAQRGKGSKVANRYLKEWDSWEKSQDSADKAWQDVQDSRRKLGKTKLTRTINSIKYG